ncbi:MAG: hypothetical protein GXO57_02015 [Thermodesulfobacteria bacterium]|nr:hypothetical protein [Thermodesulfobacteriota bacterium]
MKKKKLRKGLGTTVIAGALFLGATLPNNASAITVNNHLKIGGEWYISYQTASQGAPSQLKLERGYLRFTQKINNYLDAHITLDITQPSDNTELDGSEVVRTKYLFARFKLPTIGFLYNPKVEIGQVHSPWLDFEEHINFYRCQGTMFTERNHLFNSADFGITIFALLGGEMPSWYKKKVNPYYAGKYGSIAFGVYNGAGYHGREKNNNKPLEVRITLRPLPRLVPGLQISYFGIRGKGNSPSHPDWKVNLAFLSYESPLTTFTTQYYWGKGEMSGSDSYEKRGYSFFAEFKLYDLVPQTHLSVFGRYDYFDPNTSFSNDEKREYIAGIGYYIDKPHKNMLVLSWDKVKNEKKNANFIKVTLQVKF